MKDFFDILAIVGLTDFDLKASAAVVESVFEHRKTALPPKLSYDSQAIDNFSRGWKRFIRTLEDEFAETVPEEFAEVLAKINDLLHALGTAT